jgi:hypothetical protein
MSNTRRKPVQPGPKGGKAPGPARRKRPADVPALNRLNAPDARWQRFQRYVWDRKNKG